MAQTTHRAAPPKEESAAEKAARAAAEEAAVLAEAEAASAVLPTPHSDIPRPPTGAEAAEEAGEDTIKMYVPSGFTLIKDDLSMIHFPTGIQEVPVSVADHPYLAAQGVRAV